VTEVVLPSYDPATLVRSETVEISAPACVVWNILTDLENYGSWNPFCISAKSTLEIGAAVEMLLADYSGAGGTFANTEYVCAFVPERLLSWELRATQESPNAARRDQIIEHVDDQHCRYYSTDAFLGTNAALMMAAVGHWVKRAFDDTAIALKRHSESIYALRSAD
jgi:hypothetical protein